MKCPKCNNLDSKVVDSRQTEDGGIRRRRECLVCQHRFTTYEVFETTPLVVVKKNGSRQSFDRNKIINGLIRSCEKRPVTLDQIEEIANSIEISLKNNLKKEIPSVEIGEMVMERLKDIDDVSYVRFASVYREFKDVKTFMKEIERLITEK